MQVMYCKWSLKFKHLEKIVAKRKQKQTNEKNEAAKIYSRDKSGKERKRNNNNKKTKSKDCLHPSNAAAITQ